MLDAKKLIQSFEEIIGKQLVPAVPHVRAYIGRYATLLNNAGVNPKTIQYILGHADIAITMNRIHTLISRMSKKLGSYFVQS